MVGTGLWVRAVAGSSPSGLGGMLTVIVMFVYPLWAIAVLALDFLVLFGLLTQSEEFIA